MFELDNSLNDEFKLGRGSARYLILTVFLKREKTWLFPWVRLQLPWEGVFCVCSHRVSVGVLRSSGDGVGDSQPPPNEHSSTLLPTR